MKVYTLIEKVFREDTLVNFEIIGVFDNPTDCFDEMVQQRKLLKKNHEVIREDCYWISYRSILNDGSSLEIAFEIDTKELNYHDSNQEEEEEA